MNRTDRRQESSSCFCFTYLMASFQSLRISRQSNPKILTRETKGPFYLNKSSRFYLWPPARKSTAKEVRAKRLRQFNACYHECVQYIEWKNSEFAFRETILFCLFPSSPNSQTELIFYTSQSVLVEFYIFFLRCFFVMLSQIALIHLTK